MLNHLIAVWTGKVILSLTKLFQTGGGTAAPGLFALKIDPQLLEYFSSTSIEKAIVITGTNGKTTTSRLLSHYFSQRQISYIHNRAGSNLERGLISACITQCNWLGKFKAHYAVWELDEAAFAKVVNKIKPEQIILLNLFRDQLDRYGEVDATKNKWLTALSKATYPSQIIYNADDPQLVDLIQNLKQKNSYLKYQAFSVEYQNESQAADLFSPVELTLCPNCRTKLHMQSTVAGLGKFQCPNCGLKNGESTTTARQLSLQSDKTTGILFNNQTNWPFTLNVPGLYNIYNLAAATACIAAAQLSLDEFVLSAQKYTPVFGRMEHLLINHSEYIFLLIKNPTGFTESLKTIFNKEHTYKAGIFILNDNYADGLDVSWIWDVNLSKYVPHDLEHIIVAGTRAYDMAVRLQYAGLNKNRIVVCENIREIFKQEFVAGSQIPVFATYTASLEIQQYLEKIGVKNKYWDE